MNVSKAMKRILGGGALIVALAAAPAGAVDDSCEGSTAAAAGVDCTGVGTTDVGGQGAPGAAPASGDTQVLGTTQVRGQTLPVTGSDSLVLAGMGAGLVGAGGLLLWRSKRAEANA